MYLEVENLHKYYNVGEGKLEVLKGITFGIDKGSICVLVGPSGCGKSTLLNIIGGIDIAQEGSISVDGEKVTNMKESKLLQYRRKHLGYIFQSYNLIHNLNIMENIQIGQYLGEHPLALDDLLDTLGLWEHRNKFPNQLSGGQQQRTAIGRAIIKNPSILLCDEPTGALDYNTSKEILNLIETVNQKYGNTIVMVTHNNEVKHMAHQIIALKDGKILENYKNEHRISAKELEW